MFYYDPNDDTLEIMVIVNLLRRHVKRHSSQVDLLVAAKEICINKPSQGFEIDRRPVFCSKVRETDVGWSFLFHCFIQGLVAYFWILGKPQWLPPRCSQTIPNINKPCSSKLLL